MKPSMEYNLDDWRKVPQRLAKKAELGIKRTAQKILNASHRKVPVVTKNLFASGAVDIKGSGLHTVGIVKYTAPYSVFVERGTGLYGPRKKRIYPTTKQALFWPGAAHPVKSIAGQKPQPFLKPAFDEEAPKLAEYIFR